MTGSWEAFDGYLSRSTLLTPEGVRVARQALGLLRSALQPVASGGFFDEWREVPPEMWAPSFHVQAFAELLEIAFRVDAFSRAEGAEHILERLRQRPATKDWRHTSLQLEVAALATAVGHDVAFEPQLDSGHRGDLALTRGRNACVVEVSRVSIDRDTRQASRFSTAIFDRLRSLQTRVGIALRVQLTELAPPEVVEEWLLRIETAAGGVAEDEVVIEGPPGRAVLSPDPLAQGAHRFDGVETWADDWERIATRLKEKFGQVAGARGAWVRIDVVSGLWQMTEWAKKPLNAKLQDMNPLIRDLASASRQIEGVAMSSGLLQALTPFEDEDIGLANGSRMLRRVIEPSRVREILVVPLRSGVPATVFTEMYEAEPGWLEDALSQRGFPPVSALLHHPT